MEHQSLYRRYRPGRFADVRGQRHVIKALQNAVRDDRVGHAYLLSGPRGTGKTTLARVLAKVLNCENPVDGEPCGVCGSCKSIESGTSFDLHELDAASNNKVDDMRDLLAKVALGTPGRTKVYLLDEVHMLSSGAENALLKTLEEPPDHVVFVLATTEPHKVVPTVRSRTQHLELTLLGADEMAEHVRWVIADADLGVGDDVVDYVVRTGGGSVRDTLSALDQVVAAGGISVDDSSTGELLEALAANDPGRALTAVAEATRLGRDPRVIGEALLDALRNVFLVAMGATASHLTGNEREQADLYASQLSAPSITRALELIGLALVDMRQAPDPRVDLEVALVRLTRAATDLSLEALADRLARLERMVADGSVVAAGSTVAAPAADSSVPSAAPTPPGAAAPAPVRPAAPSTPSTSTSAAAPAPPVRPARSGPANAARTQLAKSTGRGERAAPARPARQEDAPRPAPPPRSESAPRVEPAASAEPEAVVAHAAPASGAAAMPSLEEVVAAWDSVLQSLPQKVKVRYSQVQFVEVADSYAVLELPSEGYRKRCEEVRGEVEAALDTRFGVKIPLRLIAGGGDGDSGRGSGGGGSGESGDSGSVRATAPAAVREPDPLPEEHIDLDELTDAPAGGGMLEQLTSAFPGAELLDEQ